MSRNLVDSIRSLGPAGTAAAVSIAIVAIPLAFLGMQLAYWRFERVDVLWEGRPPVVGKIVIHDKARSFVPERNWRAGDVFWVRREICTRRDGVRGVIHRSLEGVSLEKVDLPVGLKAGCHVLDLPGRLPLWIGPGEYQQLESEVEVDINWTRTVQIPLQEPITGIVVTSNGPDVERLERVVEKISGEVAVLKGLPRDAKSVRREQEIAAIVANQVELRRYLQEQRRYMVDLYTILSDVVARERARDRAKEALRR